MLRGEDRRTKVGRCSLPTNLCSVDHATRDMTPEVRQQRPARVTREEEGRTARLPEALRQKSRAVGGICRGVIIAEARRVTKNVLSAAAKAVAGKTDPTGPGAALLPGMENLRKISTAVAAAVYHAAVQDAAATKEHHDLVRSILDSMWIPEYQTGEEI